MMGGSHKVLLDAGIKFSGSARFKKLKRKGREVLDYKCRRNAVLDYFWQRDTGASTVGAFEALNFRRNNKRRRKSLPDFLFFRGGGACFRSPFRTAPAFELAIVITIPLVNKKKTFYIDPFYGKRNSDHKHIVSEWSSCHCYITK